MSQSINGLPERRRSLQIINLGYFCDVYGAIGCFVVSNKNSFGDLWCLARPLIKHKRQLCSYLVWANSCMQGGFWGIIKFSRLAEAPLRTSET